jgi:peptidoglycan/LPS O-acetylase OafA/YrhL
MQTLCFKDQERSFRHMGSRFSAGDDPPRGDQRLVKPSYMPQLDALRFLAVLGVMVAHNWHPRRLPWLLGDLDWAGLGVQLFFVLSGFLITGILLDCRHMAEKTSQSSMFFIQQFYVRRFLRIFPIYYLVVLLLILADVSPAREIWGWLVTYTTNFYITLNNEWVGRMGHFWTLAVEEQFYLIWPWLVLFAPRKWLVATILTMIPLSSTYRLYAYTNFPFDIGAMDFKAATFTVANLDTLGVGALLSLVWNSSIPKKSLQRYLTKMVLPIGIIIYVMCLFLFHYRIKPSVFFVVGDFGAALIFAWLVSSAGVGFKGRIGKLLTFPLLTYLGKITYGIYVYHNLMPLVLIPVFEHFGMPLHVPGLMNFILSTVLTIAIASLSWWSFELPINNLKRYFEYASKRTVTVSGSVWLAGRK